MYTVLPFTHFYQPQMSKYLIYMNHHQNQNLFQKVKCYNLKNLSFYNANFYVGTVMIRLLIPLFFSLLVYKRIIKCLGLLQRNSKRLNVFPSLTPCLSPRDGGSAVTPHAWGRAAILETMPSRNYGMCPVLWERLSTSMLISTHSLSYLCFELSYRYCLLYTW